MLSFQIYFERRERNPIRKQRLKDEGTPNYSEFVKRERGKLPGSAYREIRRLQRGKRTKKADIEQYREEQKQRKEERLKEKWFTTKKSEYDKLLDYHNIGVYLDKKYLDKNKFIDGEYKEGAYEELQQSLFRFLKIYRQILPSHPFSIVITDISLSKETPKVSWIPPGFYSSGDKLIFLDYNNINYKIIAHEYAHYLAMTLANNRIGAELFNQYKEMVLTKVKKRRGVVRKELIALEDPKFEKETERIAQETGIPDPYGATNKDEWFAVIIERWEDIPNTVEGYKIKQAVKKLLFSI